MLGRDLFTEFSIVFDLSKSTYGTEKVRPLVKYPLLWVDRKGGPIRRGVQNSNRPINEDPIDRDSSGVTGATSTKIGGCESQIDQLLSRNYWC